MTITTECWLFLSPDVQKNHMVHLMMSRPPLNAPRVIYDCTQPIERILDGPSGRKVTLWWYDNLVDFPLPTQRPE